MLKNHKNQFTFLSLLNFEIVHVLKIDLAEDKDHLYCIFNNIFADGLAMYGARKTEAVVLIKLSLNILY